MQNFQDTFETRKQSFIGAFSICMTVPLTIFRNRNMKYIFEQKVENWSWEGEKTLLEKIWLVFIRFTGNSTFPTLYQKLLVSLSCFSVLFLLFCNLLFSGLHSVRIKLKFWMIYDVCFVGSLMFILLDL